MFHQRLMKHLFYRCYMSTANYHAISLFNFFATIIIFDEGALIWNADSICQSHDKKLAFYKLLSSFKLAKAKGKRLPI